MGGKIRIDFSNTNAVCRLRKTPGCLCIETQKAFIHPELGLRTKGVMNTSQYDDKFISRISCFTDETNIITCFAGLNMTYNKTAFVETYIVARPYQPVENIIGQIIQLVYRIWSIVLLFK